MAAARSLRRCAMVGPQRYQNRDLVILCAVAALSVGCGAASGLKADDTQLRNQRAGGTVKAFDRAVLSTTCHRRNVPAMEARALRLQSTARSDDLFLEPQSQFEFELDIARRDGLPHSARSGRCGREHGIWGRQEARRPEGPSTAR
jgi:hypothetical protein